VCFVLRIKAQFASVWK